MTPSDAPTTLALVDEALEAGRPTAGDPDDRELQELALLLEADVPEPDPEFAAELEERLSDGFPRERRALPRVTVPAFIRRLPRPPGRSKLLAGAAASLVLATAVTVALSTGEGDDPTTRAPRTAAPAPHAERTAVPADPLALQAGSASGEVLPPEPPLDDSVAPGERERRIERSAELTLAAPDDRLEEVADDIVAVTDRRGGFVLRSTVTSGEEGRRGGSFELRVPADGLQRTLRDLSALAEVRARSQSGQDITPAYVTTRDQLVAAKAEHRSLLRRLARAETDAEADVLRERVLAAAAQVRRLRGDLRRLRERTDYAAVTVELEPKEGSDEGGAGATGAAFDDALDTLVGAFNFAVRVLGVLIPLALVSALGWLAVAVMRRRRREAALS
jgi:hypothetical protein